MYWPTMPDITTNINLAAVPMTCRKRRLGITGQWLGTKPFQIYSTTADVPKSGVKILNQLLSESTKTCQRCGIAKPATTAYFARSRQKWLKRTCLTCQPPTDLASQAAYHRAYMKKHRDKAKVYQARWLLTRPDYYARYRKRQATGGNNGNS